jgi:hypothetical protein
MQVLAGGIAMTELPPLPKHDMLGMDMYGSPSKYGWSVDQMREYGAACAAAEREAIAQVVEELADEWPFSTAVVFAAAIRARKP